jgi:hypothetical protein
MNTWTKRVVIAAAIVGLASWFGVVPAGAGIIPAPVVSPTPVAPGGNFTVSGVADCIEGTTLVVAVPDLEISAQVSGATAWQVQMTVPPGTTPGDYPVTVEQSECGYPDGELVVALSESISLVKTVGTAPGVCAATSSLSVTAGTTVYYCYTVTNNTTSTLATHSLTDDKLGVLLTDAAYDLAPGASANTVTLGQTVSAPINATTTNTATWTAHTAAGIPFTATASATVTVTTPTTTAAVEATTSPKFTG